MKPIKLAAAVVLLLAVFSSAQAHRQWLLPSATQVEGKEPWVTVDGAVSDDLFHIGANPLRLDNLGITAPDGGKQAAEWVTSGRFRGSADIKLSQPGTYRIALVNESAMASYKLDGEARRWRGHPAELKEKIPAAAEDLVVTTTISRLETYVTADKADLAVVKPLGSGLELLPLSHPNEYLADQPARFRFLFDGKPVAKLKVAIVPGGVRYRGILKESLAITDDNGEFTVTWPLPQMYWIHASYPPRAPVPEGQPRPSTLRYNYGGTFEVLPQ